ncbi:WD40 repeat-like protein [Nadsonia fulvescens var. elongata DSM 6958]|uniref:WD40 repeat-like protein n=1 Tax=Nadsonia fulvescens var. elongata DSM 6958 TaxID=857566 RepID=A0A1E3PME9_9ASCO|nr:WD40 repeat-like protein [Nadsonia fulvescens var. elongata DSM 6958]
MSWNTVGTKVALGSNDRNIRIWSADRTDDRSVVLIKNCHTLGISDLHWDPINVDRLASCSNDGTVNIWDIKTKASIKVLKPGNGNIIVKYSPDGKYLAAVRKDDVVVIFDTTDWSVLCTVKETTEVYSFDWSNASNAFATGLASGNVRIYEVIMRKKTGQSDENALEANEHIQMDARLVNILRGHRTAASSIKFDPQGKYLAIGGKEGIVSLWDLNDWICIKTFSKTDHPICSISFSHDGGYLAVASENNVPIDIINVATKESVFSITRPSFAFAPIVEWAPMKYSIAFIGDSNGLSILSANHSSSRR